MVDRAPEHIRIRFDRQVRDELAELTMTAHEHMQKGRGEPRRAPVPGCPDCQGKGEIIERGERLYCHCRYEEHPL